MLMKNNLFAAAALACLGAVGSAHAGNFLEQFLTPSPAGAADASSGISLSKTYTHLVDWGTDDGGAIVNGVVFTEGAVVGSNYTLSGTNNIFRNNPSNNYDPASGMFDLHDDFFFTGNQPPLQTLTLTGLTGGTSYILSLYLSNGWQGAPQILVGDDDGIGFNTMTKARGDGTGSKVICY